MACLTPQNSAKLASNCSIYFPLDEIQVESRQSITYAFSFPTNIGAATGINRFRIKVETPSLSLAHASNPTPRASDLLHSGDDLQPGDKQPCMPWQYVA